jgi:hypothetical protein
MLLAPLEPTAVAELGQLTRSGLEAYVRVWESLPENGHWNDRRVVVLWHRFRLAGHTQHWYKLRYP